MAATTAAGRGASKLGRAMPDINTRALFLQLYAMLAYCYEAGMHILSGMGVSRPGAQPAGMTGQVRQVGTVIAAVVIGVVAVVGIYIFDSVYTTMPSPENSDLNNSTDSVTSGFGDALEFVPVILIVLMAVVVIGAIQRLRQP